MESNEPKDEFAENFEQLLKEWTALKYEPEEVESPTSEKLDDQGYKETVEKMIEVQEQMLTELNEIDYEDFQIDPDDEDQLYIFSREMLATDYLKYLMYYAMMRFYDHPLKDHPVLERIVEVEQVWEGLSPFHQFMMQRINKNQQQLMQAALKEQLSVEKSTEAVPQSNSAEAEESLRPRPDLMDFNEVEEVSENVYKAPKVVPVEYKDDIDIKKAEKAKRQKEKELKKLRESEVTEALREEFQITPTEVAAEGKMRFDSRTAQLFQEHREREEFEEEYMRRLPKNKKQKKLEKSMARAAKGYTSKDNLDDFNAFIDATNKAIFKSSNNDMPTRSRKKR